MEWDTKHSKTCGGAWQTYCRRPNFRLQPTFFIAIGATAPSKTLARNPASLPGRAALWAWLSQDYDDDGFTDIFRRKRRHATIPLPQQTGDGTFTECALESGAALSADGKPLSGMGTVFQDYDNDGKPDIIVYRASPRDLRPLPQ